MYFFGLYSKKSHKFSDYIPKYLQDSEKSASFWGTCTFLFVVCGLLFHSCALGVEEFISTLDEELAVDHQFLIFDC